MQDPNEKRLQELAMESEPQLNEMQDSFSELGQAQIPISSANPQAPSPLERFIEMQKSQQKRLADAQRDEQMRLGGLAFLRGAQRDRAGSGRALSQLAGLPTKYAKDMNKLEAQSFKDEQGLSQMQQKTSGDKAAAKLYRDIIKQEMPQMEISDDVPVDYLKQLLLLKQKGKKGGSAAPFQQSQYMTQTGDPVHFNKETGRYLNTLTGQPISNPGSLIRNYTKTVTDPRTGEIVEIRPGVGMVGSLTPSKGQDGKTKTVKAEEPVDFTFEMLNPNQKKELKDIEQQYMKDVEDSREFGDILANITDLVQADISAAIPAIKRQLARSVGKEVGVMTDKDVEAFSGDQSFIGALERFGKLKATGKMTERDKLQYRQLINIATRNLDKAMKVRGNYHTNRLSKRVPNATKESLQSLLSLESSKPTVLQPEKARVTMDGRTFRINKDKVDAFKKKYPSAKVEE